MDDRGQKDPEAVAFGAAVLAARKTAGWSQETLANRAGIERQYVSTIENGKQVPSITVAIRLSRALSVPVSELLGEAPVVQETVKTVEHETVLTADEQELLRVPLVARGVAAGHGSFPEPVDSRYYFFRADSIRDIVGPGAGRKDRLGVVFLDPRERFGESMTPTIQPGSLVLIDRQVSRIEDRSIYLVEYPDMGEDAQPLAIKRLTLDAKKRLLVAESDNPDPQYAPVIVDLAEEGLEWEHVVKGKVVLWSTEARPRKPPVRLKTNRQDKR